MDKSKKKLDQSSSLLREPKAKKTLGLKVPAIQMPHLELVKTEDTIEKNKLTQPSQTGQSSNTSQTRRSSQTRQPINSSQIADSSEPPIAPSRDYQKVPNSHTKKAIPQGFFKPGKSKHLYDVLYSLTRGSIEPKRSVRISKTRLMKQAGIGSRITFDSIISNFESSGLIKVTIRTGEHEGNEFEVFTYDEIVSLPSTASQSSQTSSGQKLDGLVGLENSQSSQGLNVDNNDTSANLKTFFKTLNFSFDDEEIVRTIFEKLNTSARSATGKDLTSRDWQAFEDIVDLILNETAVARTRTKSISVFLKFAAENLRRRLYSKPKTQKNYQQKEKANWIEVGKNDSISDEYDEQGNYIPKPLDEKGRDEALQILIDYQSWNAPIEDSKKFYTEKDWQWLMESLSATENETKN